MSERVDLSALDALAEAATEGPWRVEQDTDLIWSHDPDRPSDIGLPIIEGKSPSYWQKGKPDWDERYANAALIVALRNAYPALAAELRALREALDGWELVRDDVVAVLENSSGDDAHISAKVMLEAAPKRAGDDWFPPAALGSQP